MNKAEHYLQFGGCWCLLVGCLTSQQHASVSQRRICSDKCTCCRTETEVADQSFYLTQSQYADTGPTGPRADYVMLGACQGSYRSTSFYVTGMTQPRNRSTVKAGIELRSTALKRNALPLGQRGGESGRGVGDVTSTGDCLSGGRSQPQEQCL